MTTQPPAPFHPIARGFTGRSLLAMTLVDKYANHQVAHAAGAVGSDRSRLPAFKTSQ
jgi:transposase